MADLPRLALSVRQPWPWAIIYLRKDIENRSWRPWSDALKTARQLAEARTRIAIHASAGVGKKGEFEEDCDSISDIISPDICRIPDKAEIERGGIVGSAELVGVVDRSDSPWFFGPIGLVLANPEPLPFRPCKGTLIPMFWPWPEAA